MSGRRERDGQAIGIAQATIELAKGDHAGKERDRVNGTNDGTALPALEPQVERIGKGFVRLLSPTGYLLGELFRQCPRLELVIDRS